MPIFTQVIIRPTRALTVAAAVLLAGGGLAGCGKKSVRAYTVPKEVAFEPATDETPAPPEPAFPREQWRPEVKYTLPAGWADVGPDKSNVVRLKAGECGVAITPLMSLAGQESGLVNMYRQVRGLAPLDEAEALKALTPVSVGTEMGKMFEITDSSEGKPRRFLVAFIHRPEGSLFIKLQGDDAKVLEQKPTFLEFLKSIRLTGGTVPIPADEAGAAADPHAAGAPPPAAPQSGATPSPAPDPKATPAISLDGKAALPGWKPLTPGAMQQAKFQVPEVNGAKAEAALSIFGTDAGGTAANVKRWRAQLGLPDMDDVAAVASAKPLEGAPTGSLIVHLENGPAALTAAIVPRNGQWYFYKLFGDTAAVNAALEAFTAFAKLQP
jgi:hypothetical protein